ncbi:UTRA domain-containing protein [Roseobacter sp. HKCCD9010]|uniref:GntR family transcriptional regulator n=1 Tax=unclassified Roseobacter TaxID=196798 RepID=UPI0014916ED5|nr:UTRA domain-containing protein [Rhodobacterales bacterium HKCCD4356]NNV12395.1 UTRA domain-containing protein [Roseobacter sp. HKCCD7357]NNV16141.1 UTRA domain-containing protein [Roseobacter sp. HKCCD8768]NNV25601.1 UTRA domain-containing protein [Roseobacter sp. HKCCD8192]NNV29857.1 UTRA domain-containing protein [Roseobacter sp. HKCCD9061]NNV34327.1 UTRA domain-containing protein [Roseobacter sp. HKCCD9073]NNV38575.1 UTRA domain-containing protein [Roseobacter sp. HKCCD9054]NNV42533.1 
MTEPGALPAYLQISEMLIRDIAAGRLADGQRLPPEREMAAEHGVSVMTLRKALAELETRKLLERRQGSGNTIRANGEIGGVYALFRLELLEGGGFPTARVLDVSREAKPDNIPDLGSDTPFAWRIRRVRSLNRQPVSAEEIWLDGRFTETLAADELSQSLYLYYRETLKLAILRAEDRVGVDTAPDWTPDEIGLPSGAPACLVARRTWSQANDPIEFSRSWVNTSRACYVARIS